MTVRVCLFFVFLASASECFFYYFFFIAVFREQGSSRFAWEQALDWHKRLTTTLLHNRRVYREKKRRRERGLVKDNRNIFVLLMQMVRLLRYAGETNKLDMTLVPHCVVGQLVEELKSSYCAVLLALDAGCFNLSHSPITHWLCSSPVSASQVLPGHVQNCANVCTCFRVHSSFQS